MSNNLKKIEKDLRAFAKRCKDVKYTQALLYVFLMTGAVSFTATTAESIEGARKEIKTSITDMKKLFKDAKRENNKLMKQSSLELIQLMEQGDHVVKSPWSSWQYGMNYFYNDWRGTYKGRGDKKDKYPYEGILTRDANEFNRYLPVTSENYRSLGASSDPMSASSNSRKGMKGYGIASTKLVVEPPVEIAVNAGINPKSVNKVPLNIAAKVANSPTLPEAVKFAPIDPTIVIPADPALPAPPSFKVIVGADCNAGDGISCATGSRVLTGTAGTDGYEFLQYTWQSSNEAQGLAFKWFDAVTSGATFIYGSGAAFGATGTSVTVGTDTFTGTSRTSGTTISINSYNGLTGLSASTNTTPVNRNNQYFLVGGSRAIEADMYSGGGAVINKGTVNLGGILTLGMVTQTSSSTNHVINDGTITDVNEKNDAYVRNVRNVYNTDTDGDGTNDALKIYGPTPEEYNVKLSDDGYVGYKIGVAVVPENTNLDKTIAKNTGNINFYGANSIGMYVYLPTTLGATNTTFDGTLLNSGNITLSGKESYGMKMAGKTGTNAKYENAGIITLKKNVNDAADGSAGMALMDDSTVVSVNLAAGVAKNSGTIKLENVKNSLGTYVNINSDITNTATGKININSTIAPLTEAEISAGKSQPVNIGMRSDTNANAKVINNGEITIDGAYAIGMLANGSKLVNTKKITSTNIKNGVGIVGINGANIENRGAIKVLGTGDTKNIGVFLNSGSIGTVGTIPSGDPAPSIEVSGNNSTGVLVTGTGSSLTMKGNVTVSGNSITGIVANGTTVKLENDGTVKVDNNGAVAGQIDDKGSYGIVVKGATGKFEGLGTTADIKVTTDKSIGLYSEGDLTVKKANVTATDGAINFFAKDGKININNGGTTETGQKSLLFYTSGTGKVILGGQLDATIKGGTTPSTRGTAFYYVSPTRYGVFNSGAIQAYFNSTFGNGSSTLNHLKLNMEQGSRLFVASNVGMNLSDTSATSLMSGITNAPTIIGSPDYKTFMLYLSKLTINQAVDLNDPNSSYAKLEIANSSIDNENNMTGSNNRQVAIAQENGNDTSGNGYNADEVTLTNKATGVINLTGEETTGIYAKRGAIFNEGSISVGKKSTGIYIVEDDRSPSTATAGARAVNEATGVITIGEDSTGMFYKVDPDNADGRGTNTAVGGGIINDGKIESSANNALAMSFDSPYSSKTVSNSQTGIIDLQGQNSTGIFATGTGTYAATNDGTIKLASSADVNTPNIGIYTDKDAITLENNGTIEGGDKTVGIYGYNVNLGTTSTTKVGSGGTGVYSKGGNVTINGGTLSVGENGIAGSNDAVGVYYVGAGGTITNNAADVKIGDSAYGFVVQNENGAGVSLVTNTPNVTLGNDAVYTYSNNRAGTVINNTVLNSTGDGNYGVYSAGTVTNNGQINFGTGIGNVGIYSILGGTATNNSAITVGASDAAAEKFAIGMAAGYRSSDSGNVINGPTGVINVTGKDSIGMYATGPLSTATNKGKILLQAENTIGMYLDNGATGINEGEISTVGSPKGAKGVVLSNNSKLINRAGAKINIDSEEGFGIYRVNTEETNITIANYGDITVSGGAVASGLYDPTGGKPLEKTAGGVTMKVPKGTTDIDMRLNGNPAPYVEQVTEAVGHRGDALISTLGMYVDTKRATNPIKGMDKLNVRKAELLFGIEAADDSNAKYFEVSGNLLKPYQDAMKTSSVKWVPNSAVLTWMALPAIDANGVPVKVGMAKIPYTEFAGNEATPVEVKDTYNFLDGLEQRYDKNEIGSREKLLFNKLNHIGNNEEVLFYQATDEMMGHQYANVQQRTYGTGRMIDKEISHLSKEWDTKSRQSNKIKMFGMRDEYNTDTAGIIDYKSNAYGFAYLHEDETVKLGHSSGWYAGAVHNRFKFKDIGGSKENQTMLKLGVFKTMSPAKDHNGSLQWTISGEGYVSRNHMHRKYLVVDEIFNAKSDYTTYGVALNNQLGYNIRTSERTSIRPYGGLKLEYGRFSNIKEKSGEMRLDIKGNDYFSVKPEVGVEFNYRQPMAVRTTFVTSLGLGYENELGQVGNVKNKAKVSYTEADWFNIRGEKDDRKGNFKADLNIGVENQRFGVTLNGGYDTKGKNVRGGLGFRIIY